MDRHIARTIVRNSAGDARVIWSIFSGYHPQELRESGEQNGEPLRRSVVKKSSIPFNGNIKLMKLQMTEFRRDVRRRI